MHNLEKGHKRNQIITIYTFLEQIKKWNAYWKNHRNSWNATLRCKKQHPVENSQKGSCLPRLSPSGPRNILHSSICPKGENITRISFSLHFFDIIPINNFLSSTAKKSKDKSITSKYAPTRSYFVKFSLSTVELLPPLIRGIPAAHHQIPNNGTFFVLRRFILDISVNHMDPCFTFYWAARCENK